MKQESIQQEATVGRLLTDAINLHELDVNTVEKEMDLPNGILTKLMNDEFYTNSIPVVLFKNLIVSLHIPIKKVIDAMIPTFKLLQSKETPKSIKEKPMGYMLWENEDALKKYTDKLISMFVSGVPVREYDTPYTKGGMGNIKGSNSEIVFKSNFIFPTDKQQEAKTAEEILREYVSFDDVNGSELVLLLPLTITDAMEEYASQFTASPVQGEHGVHLDTGELEVLLNLCDQFGKPYDGFRFREAVLSLRKNITFLPATPGPVEQPEK